MASKIVYLLVLVVFGEPFSKIQAQMMFPESIPQMFNSTSQCRLCRFLFNFSEFWPFLSVALSQRKSKWKLRCLFAVSRNNFPLYPQYPNPNIVPLQNLIPFQAAIPATPTTGIQTCICVPIGTCTGIGTVPNPTTVDGSGIIDIRIVNNVILFFSKRIDF